MEEESIIPQVLPVRRIGKKGKWVPSKRVMDPTKVKRRKVEEQPKVEEDSEEENETLEDMKKNERSGEIPESADMIQLNIWAKDSRFGTEHIVASGCFPTVEIAAKALKQFFDQYGCYHCDIRSKEGLSEEQYQQLVKDAMVKTHSRDAVQVAIPGSNAFIVYNKCKQNMFCVLD